MIERLPGSARERTAPAGARTVRIQKAKHLFARLFQTLGPGFITGASDDDPTSVGTGVVAGASYGYSLLWIVPLTVPMMVISQFLATKVGVVTGGSVSRLIKDHYSRYLLWPIVVALIVTNVVTIGADFAAIIAASQMFIPIPKIYILAGAAVIMAGLLGIGSYRLMTTVFKWLALTLGTYVVAAVLAHPDPLAVLKGTVIPTISWNKTFISVLVALLGTSVTPYMFFWQSSQEVEEQRSSGTARPKPGTVHSELRYAAWDVVFGMFFTQLIQYFMIVAAGATLFVSGHRHVQSAVEAAQALKPLAGNAATVLFAVGIIGSGFLAIPVLAATDAYALSDLFGWRASISSRAREAKQFYSVIIASVCIGAAVNLIGWNPISALVWAAMISGFLAAPLLALLLMITSNKQVMGARTNSFAMNIAGWITVVVIAAASLALVTA